MFVYEDIDRKPPFRFFMNENFNWYAHMHKHIEVVYMLEGELNVEVDLKEKTLKPGDVMLCFPNCVHRYSSDTYNRFYLLVFDVNFTGDFAQTFLKYIPEIPFLQSKDVHPEILQCLKMMKPDETNTAVIKGYLQIIAARLFEAIKLKKISASHHIYLDKQILTYIMQNFKNTDLSLGGISKALNVSERTVSNVFANKIGVKYVDYLNSYRVEYARLLLTDSDFNMTETSYESGFNNVRTFNRAFKKTTGITPTEYKKLYGRT